MNRLGIDARLLNASGIGRYLSNLLPGVLDSTSLDMKVLGDGSMLREEHPWLASSRVEYIDCDSKIYSLQEQIELSRKIPDDLDLFWSPHYNVPAGYRGRLAVTIHDALHISRKEYVAGLHRQLYAWAMFRIALQKARVVICDSQFTADELIHHAGAAESKLRVIHLGIDREWFAADPGESPHPRPYLLYVGNVKPHKNLGRLVEAFTAIMDEIEHDLVIVGKREGFITGDPAVAQRAARAGSRIQFTGTVTDTALRSYLQNTDALVHPSLYEGFGFSPLEAMAAGSPAIVARAASIPEVCGDAAVYFDPMDPQDIGRQIRRVLSNRELREEMVERGAERVAHFTWERCTAETLAALEEAAG